MIQFYSFFDKKAACYTPPFQAKHVAEATRAVQQHMEEGKSIIAKYPADHALYLVGAFDETTGFFDLNTQAICPSFTIECAALVPAQKGSNGTP